LFSGFGDKRLYDMHALLRWFNRTTKRQHEAANPLHVLPDFQSFEYTIAIEPVGSRVSAWVKLRETERRLAMYKWVAQYNDPANPQHRVLLNDSASGFLLTFEATLQFLLDQFKRSGFSQQSFHNWLSQQNDIYIKGLRTLRHLEAHLEAKPIPRTVDLHISSSLGEQKSDTKLAGYTWYLPRLEQDDLNKLHTPPLSTSELGDWNALVTRFDAGTIFARGLNGLKAVLEAAEQVI
jgi:hypothetical protein